MDAADAAGWLDGLVSLARAEQPRSAPLVRLATVASTHTNGDPRLVFDGETSPTTKTYPRLQEVRAGDRVLCLRAGSTYVVVAALGSSGPLALSAPDRRGTAYAPGDAVYPARTVTGQFTRGTDIGLPGVFYTVHTVQMWADDTGGGAHQIAYGEHFDNAPSLPAVWHRYGTRGGGWRGWERIGGGDTAWHTIGAAGEPSYAGGWSAYGDTDYGTAQFRKTGPGLVVMRGLATAPSGGGSQVGMFTLPAGYRPARSLIFCTQSNSAPVELRVFPSGAVVPWQAAGGAWFSIACTFYAEQ